MEERKNAMQLAATEQPATIGELLDFLNAMQKTWTEMDTQYLGRFEDQPLYIIEYGRGFQLADAKYFAEFGLTFTKREDI